MTGAEEEQHIIICMSFLVLLVVVVFVCLSNCYNHWSFDSRVMKKIKDLDDRFKEEVEADRRQGMLLQPKRRGAYRYETRYINEHGDVERVKVEL